jgi:hypothetical protein
MPAPITTTIAEPRYLAGGKLAEKSEEVFIIATKGCCRWQFARRNFEDINQQRNEDEIARPKKPDENSNDVINEQTDKRAGATVTFPVKLFPALIRTRKKHHDQYEGQLCRKSSRNRSDAHFDATPPPKDPAADAIPATSAFGYGRSRCGGALIHR